MTFSRLDSGVDGATVLGDGEITPDTPTAFVNFLNGQRPPAVTHLALSSDGGDLAAGLALGRMVRRFSLSTIVGERTAPGANGPALGASRCSSACALAFLGGERREITQGSDFGIHQLRMDCVERWKAVDRYPWLPLPDVRYCPAFNDGMSAFQIAQGEVSAYLNEMGVNPELFTRMSEVPAMQVSFLSEDELISFGVITPTEASARAAVSSSPAP